VPKADAADRRRLADYCQGMPGTPAGYRLTWAVQRTGMGKALLCASAGAAWRAKEFPAIELRDRASARYSPKIVIPVAVPPNHEGATDGRATA
jgi:hypothetical protein